MANKNITQDGLTNENNRIREAARTLVEEYRRKHDERLMSQATVATYNRLAGQVMLTPEGKSFFRRSKDHREEASENTVFHSRKAKKTGIQGVCIRLIPGAPYYIN